MQKTSRDEFNFSYSKKAQEAFAPLREWRNTS
jgi:hypothetical protein